MQTRAVLVPALLEPAESSLDKRLTNSLGCPPNVRNSQVIRRVRFHPRVAGRRFTERHGDRTYRAGLLQRNQQATCAHRQAHLLSGLQSSDETDRRHTSTAREPPLGAAAASGGVTEAAVGTQTTPADLPVIGSSVRRRRRRVCAAPGKPPIQRRPHTSLCGKQHRQYRGVGMADGIDADATHHRRDGAVGFGLHPGRSVL